MTKEYLVILITSPILIYLLYKLSLEIWCLTYGVFN